jgi:formimidoylglutamate deiminase
MSRCWRPASPGSASSTICITTGRRAYADHRRDGDRIAAAAADTGIGLTLLPVFYAHGGFGGAPPGRGQRRFLNASTASRLVEASRRAVAGLPDAVVGVAPHSLRAVTPDELPAIAAAGPAPIHIHIAEQTREVDDCLAWSGQRPVEWLLDHAGVDARWCLVHATHLTPAETLGLARERRGRRPVPDHRGQPRRRRLPGRALISAPAAALGVGTDSNVLIDAAQELRALEYASGSPAGRATC